MQKREIKVFISSTFHDMQSERNHLVHKVFPLLRRMASERDVVLTEIDLRWGITREESESGKTVEICLSEIEGARPFFIGMLGDRYGWVPSAEEQATWQKLPERFKWVYGEMSKGTSITEIEIKYGTFMSTLPVDACFYLRENEHENEEHERLQQLKAKIRSQQRFRWHEYGSLDALSDMVIADFKLILDKYYPEANMSENELEQLRMYHFLKQKTALYVPNLNVVQKLDDFILGNGRQIVVTGENGSGKTALVAWWMENNPLVTGEYNKLVFSTAVEQKNLKIDDIKDKLVATASEIKDDRPVLLILDGFDRVDFRSSNGNVDWTQVVPHCTKVVYTASAGTSVANYLLTQEIECVEVPQLLLHQRAELAAGYFRQYGKRMMPEQLELITRPIASVTNVSVFIMLLEEIRCFGEYDDLPAYLQKISALKSSDELCDFIIACKEQAYNTPKYPDLVKRLLLLIVLSYEGLEPTDIIAISRIPALYCMAFLSANTTWIYNNGGEYMITDQRMLDAIKRRYLSSSDDAVQERSIRQQIVAYSEQQEHEHTRRSQRITDELAYQYFELHDYDKLYAVISPFSFLASQMSARHPYFIRFWTELISADAERYTPRIYIEQILSSITQIRKIDLSGGRLSSEDEETYFFYQKLNTLSRFCDLLNNGSQNRKAVSDIAREVIGLYDCNLELFANDHVSWLVLAASMEMDEKNYNKAAEYFDRAYDEVLRYDCSSHAVLSVFNGTACVCLCIAESRYADNRDEAVTYAEKAIQMFEKIITDDHLMDSVNMKFRGDVYCNLADVYRLLGDKEKGLAIRRKGIEMYLSYQGVNNIDVAIEYDKMSQTAFYSGSYDEALRFVNISLKIYDAIYGAHNIRVTDDMLLKAHILVRKGDHDMAKDIIDEVYAVEPEFAGVSERTDHLEYMYSVCYDELKDVERALEYAREVIVLNPDVDNADTAWANSACADCLLLEGDTELAIEHYEKAISIFINQADMVKAIHTMMLLSRVYYGMQKLRYADAILNHCVTLAEENNLCTHPDFVNVLHSLYVISLALGNAADAADYLDRAINLQRELAGDDNQKLHDLYREKERFEGAGQDSAFDEETDADDEVREFAGYTDDTETVSLFSKGTGAFARADYNTALQCFGKAVQLCREHEDAVALALSLRYMAYSEECMGNAENADLIERYYDEAYDLAVADENFTIAQRIIKDEAEFFFNRMQWECAAYCYCEELGLDIRAYDYLDIKTIACVNNLSYVWSKCGSDYCDETVYAAVLTHHMAVFAGDEMNNIVESVNNHLAAYLQQNNLMDKYDLSLLTAIDFMIKWLADNDHIYSAYCLNGFLNICRPVNDDGTAVTERMLWHNHGYIGLAGYDYEMVEEAREHLEELGEKDVFVNETDFHYLAFDDILMRARNGFLPCHNAVVLSAVIDSCDTDMLKQFVAIIDGNLQSDTDEVLWNAARWLCGEQFRLTDELSEKINSASPLVRMQTAYCMARAGHTLEAEQLYDGVVNDIPDDTDERYIRLYALIWFLLNMGMDKETTYYLNELESLRNNDETCRSRYLDAFARLLNR